MACPARRIIVPLLLAGSVARVAFGQAPSPNDPVGTARELYASARYDEALAVLNDLKTTENASSAERRSIEQYRSLCLLALGRGTEAESAIAAVVTTDPTYLPSENDASPRVRAAFSEVRRRLLPELATSRYTEAKSAYDRKDYAAAINAFHRVLALLDDPDMAGRLADLRVLASGFLDLSVAAATPRPEPKKEVPPPPAPTPPAGAGAPGAGRGRAPRPSPRPPPGPPRPRPSPRPPPPGDICCGASICVRSCANPLGMISPLLIQTFTPIRPKVVRASKKP
jgi:hypothetical protein